MLDLHDLATKTSVTFVAFHSETQMNIINMMFTKLILQNYEKSLMCAEKTVQLLFHKALIFAINIKHSLSQQITETYLL